MYVAVFAISFLATCLGAICGLGGGVIIKPVMDASGLFPVDAVNFLSGCTVLAMAAYSVGRSRRSGEARTQERATLPLAIGAAMGGWAGRQAYAVVRGLLANPDSAAAVQAVLLMAVTAGTLVYTLLRERIPGHHLRNPLACALLGLLLGALSSFLGIGGGPINLAVLLYCFSMDIKSAAQCSLLVILISQATSTVTALLTQDLSHVDPLVLVGMVAMGIAGGAAGRRVNARISAATVSRLFIAIMVAIIALAAFNFQRYATL